MSRANPKSKYLATAGKAVSYQILREEAGTGFYATVPGVVFSLPDSNADANVVGCVVKIGCQTAATSGATIGTDQFFYKGSFATSIQCLNPGDSVDVYCPVPGVWGIVEFEGSPLFGGEPMADEPYSAWTEFEATWVSSSTFTVDADSALMDNLHAGVPVLSIDSTNPANTKHCLVKAVTLPPGTTKPLVTITGDALLIANDQWFYGGASQTEHRVITIPGNFNDADDANLIRNDLSTFFRWDEDDAYLVNVEVICLSADFIADPSIDVIIGGVSALSPALAVNASWADAGIAFSGSTTIAFNDLIEVGVTNGVGANNDAQDLTVVLTFVKDKNSKSDFDPCPLNAPVLNMIISGLVGPDTWCGLSNGIHAVCPNIYSLIPNPLSTREDWKFRTVPTYTPTIVFADEIEFHAYAKRASTTGPATYAWSRLHLRKMLTAGYSDKGILYSISYHPAPWPGRVRDRLMGTAVLGGATFTWSKMGNRWYVG